MYKLPDNRNKKSQNMIGENELEQYIDNDLQCLSHLPVGFAVGDQYCQCGKTRSNYPYEFEDVLSQTNENNNGLRDTNGRLISNNILNIDKSSIFLTKKSLMLNQFLEYTVNDTKNVKVENTIHRLEDISGSFSRSRTYTLRNNNNFKNHNTTNSRNKKNNCNNSVGATTMFCTTSSLLLDKRFVSLLRGITLYWFICLNTVLVRSEVLKKKVPIVFDEDGSAATTILLDAISSTSISESPLSCDLAKLQMSLRILENAHNLESDVLWSLFRDTVVQENQTQNHLTVLPLERHSRVRLSQNFLRTLLRMLINMWFQSSTILDLRSTFAFIGIEPFDSEHNDGVELNKVCRMNCVTTTSCKNQRGSKNEEETISESTIEREDELLSSVSFVVRPAPHDEELTLFLTRASSDPAIKSYVTATTATVVADTSDSGSWTTVSSSSDDESTTEYPDDVSTNDYSDNESVDYSISDVNSDRSRCSSRSDESNSVDGDEVVWSSEADDSEVMEFINPADTTNVAMPVDENRFFLPTGIFSCEKLDYPLYNLWRSPLNSLSVLRARDQSELKLSTNESSPNDDNFTPYRMWASPVVATAIANNENIAKKFSYQSATEIISSSPKPPFAALQQLRNVEGSANHCSAATFTYNLWGSPRMIDVRQLSSSDCGVTFGSCATNTPKGHLGTERHEIPKSRLEESFLPGHGTKFADFKPIVNERVSFTDRGAFEYYRKPIKLSECCDMSTDCSPLSLIVNDDWYVTVEANNVSCAETKADIEFENPATTIDNEVLNDNVEADDDEDEDDESQEIEALNCSYVFKPIQPAFKVSTDAPPQMVRSPSGGYYLNHRKMFVFEHELDCKSVDPYLFQPKYAVSPNDKACQTEPEIVFQPATSLFTRNPYLGEPSNAAAVSRQYSHFGPLTSQPWTVSHFLSVPQLWSAPQPSPAPQLWSTPQPSSAPELWLTSQSSSTFQPVSNPQPLYYGLDDMFNCLGQPGFANVDGYEKNLTSTFSPF